MKIIFILIFTPLIICISFGQDNQTDGQSDKDSTTTPTLSDNENNTISTKEPVDIYEPNSLKSLYESLGYQTDINDVTGEKWEITEPWLIRQIIENLYNNGKLDFNKGSDSDSKKDDLKKIAEAILENQVRIICTKRFYDKNLSSLTIKLDTTLEFKAIDSGTNPKELKTINGWVEISNDITEKSYNNILTKNYSYNDLTRRDSPAFAEPKLVLNIYNSELFLYKFKFQNWKIFISTYYRLGNDKINLPSWYKGNILTGLNIRVNPSNLPNRLDYEEFGISIGWDVPINFSIQRDFVPSFVNDIFKDRLLVGTSDNLFLGLSYAPKKLYDNKEEEFIHLTAEGSFVIINKKKTNLALRNVSDFQSIRTHWSFSGTLGNIDNWLDIGVSVSGLILNKYSALVGTDDLELLNSKHHLLFSFEPAISREDPPFYYKISPQLSSDITNGGKFLIFKSIIFFGINMGIDFRYFISLNGDKTVPWHYKDYIVISPIIIIN